MNPTELYTIGHSNHSAGRFLTLLKQHKIRLVADVRRYPASRRHPHFNGPQLESTLRGNEIDYEWFESLGGHRTQGINPSPNGAITDDAFRNYADHMLGDEFRCSVDRLLEVTSRRRVAVMCAEAAVSGCHRRLLSDSVVARGFAVRHIGSDGAVVDHILSDGAEVRAGQVTYPEHLPLFDELTDA